MADRRKRKVGQIWSTRRFSYSNAWGLPPGKYQILDTFNQHGLPFIKVYEVDRGREFSIPRRMITTAGTHPFVYEGERSLPSMTPRVVICQHCGKGDVVESISQIQHYTCKYCGG